MRCAHCRAASRLGLMFAEAWFFVLCFRCAAVYLVTMERGRDLPVTLQLPPELAFREGP